MVACEFGRVRALGGHAYASNAVLFHRSPNQSVDIYSTAETVTSGAERFHHGTILSGNFRDFTSEEKVAMEVCRP